jgi:hypothetical protein
LDTVHGKGVQTYSPPGACGCCLMRTLGRKRINVGADGMLKCANGTSLGADAKTTGADACFPYAYVCSPGADVCAACADVNESCSGKYGTGVGGI